MSQPEIQTEDQISPGDSDTHTDQLVTSEENKPTSSQEIQQPLDDQKSTAPPPKLETTVAEQIPAVTEQEVLSQDIPQPKVSITSPKINDQDEKLQPEHIKEEDMKESVKKVDSEAGSMASEHAQSSSKTSRGVTPSTLGTASRKTSRHMTPLTADTMPKLKQHSRAGARTDELSLLIEKTLHIIDKENSNLLPKKEFIRALRSPLLNLRLTTTDVNLIIQRVHIDSDGKIAYLDFIPAAREIIAHVYRDRGDISGYWVMLCSIDGDTLGYYNKASGKITPQLPEGVTCKEPNLIEDTIYDILEIMDKEGTGVITESMFLDNLETLKTGSLGLTITPEEVNQIKQIFEIKKEKRDQVFYEDFMPVLLELICRTYQSKDPSYVDWIQLDSSNVGTYWFNKRTGQCRRNMSLEFMELYENLVMQQQERAQEIAFVQQTLHDLESTNQDIQMERAKVSALENQVALLNEEMETLMAQLDETGTTLDKTSSQLREKNQMVDSLSKQVIELEEESTKLKDQLYSVQNYHTEIEDLRGKLQVFQSQSENYSQLLSGKDDSMIGLKRNLTNLSNKLKIAEDSLNEKIETVTALELSLKAQQTKNEDLEEELLKVTEYEQKLDENAKQLEESENMLEERNTALAQLKKNLMVAKQRTQELENELQQMAHLRDKLHHSRCEINTMKEFLASKTVLVRSRDLELEKSNVLIASLQLRDKRRTQILTTVLERTARLQQQHSEQRKFIPETARDITITKSLSTGNLMEVNEKLARSNFSFFPYIQHRKSDVTRIKQSHETSHASKLETSNAILPKIESVLIEKKRLKQEFSFATTAELKSLTKIADLQMKKDTELLDMRFNRDPDPLNIKIGDRVEIDLRKREMDISNQPSSFFGIVRYVGTLDSVYIDRRQFVGVKLDQPNGYCDGLYQGKRYFSCNSKHGVLVNSNQILSVFNKNLSKYVAI